MQGQKEIYLKTEEVDELMTAIPKWIIRWGISIIFTVMLSAFILSMFIKYPDRLTAQATITTTNPPVTLISKVNGKIAELSVKNNQFIKKGNLILVIENTTDHNDINKLTSILNTLKIKNSKTLPSITIFDSLQMGDLTPIFLEFLNAYTDYKLFTEIDPQQKEIDIINKEFEKYQQLQSKYETQESIYKQELSLIEKDHKRYNTLFQNQSISPKEFEDKERDYLAARRNYENVKITSLNNKLIIDNLEKDKLKLVIEDYQQKEKYNQNLDQHMQDLISQVKTWEQDYLIKAPIDGTISFFNYWSNNQNIKQGDEVVSIVPVDKQEIISKLILPVQNSGKLKTGQVVNIKLDNYAYPEYGMIKGIVKTISLMPKKENYSVEVSLPNKLITSYKKNLDYQEEMQGTADIITEELSVFDRVFYQFRKILKK
ncbi:MAG: HlyD family secretion protein [Bacteroidota bacterium]